MPHLDWWSIESRQTIETDLVPLLNRSGGEYKGKPKVAEFFLRVAEWFFRLPRLYAWLKAGLPRYDRGHVLGLKKSWLLSIWYPNYTCMIYFPTFSRQISLPCTTTCHTWMVGRKELDVSDSDPEIFINFPHFNRIMDPNLMQIVMFGLVSYIWAIFLELLRPNHRLVIPIGDCKGIPSKMPWSFRFRNYSGKFAQICAGVLAPIGFL